MRRDLLYLTGKGVLVKLVFIENIVFNKLKIYVELEHCFVYHPNAIEAIVHLMSTVTNIMQLFRYKRLTSETARNFIFLA